MTKKKSESEEDELPSQKLQREIDSLEKDFPNTFKRANAVVDYLYRGKAQKDIAKEFRTSEGSIRRWTKIYQKKGIKGLNSLESFSIGQLKEDTTKHLHLYKQFMEEIPELNQNFSMLKKTNALASYFSGETTKEDAASTIEVSSSIFSKWVDTYNYFGIDGLKNMETFANTQQKKAHCINEELSKKLQKDIAELDEAYPNTRIRANAIAAYLKGEGSQKAVAAEIGTSATSIRNWEKNYRKDHIIALMRMEHIPIGQQKKDTAKNQLLYHQLLAEMPDLHQDFPALKKANALASYFNGEATKEKAASAIKISHSIFSDWIDTYQNYGIKGLQQIEHMDLGQRSEATIQPDVNSLGGAAQNQEQRQEGTENDKKQSAISNNQLPRKKRKYTK